MHAFINKIWYKGHFICWVLWPLSCLFALITACRRGWYRLSVNSQTTLAVPVIVVGNITVGGSGKTPTVIYLIELLRQHGFHPGVISRGYGANIQGVKVVRQTAKASEVGDEPAMIVARTQVPMVVGADRVAAARALITEFDVDVIICDDGLQHYALARDIELVVIDGERGLGNQHLLPAGPLREGAWRLRQVDFVVVNGGQAEPGQFLMQLAPTQLHKVNASCVGEPPKSPTLHAHLQANPIVAMAGIGYPVRFFETLKAQGYQLAACHAFNDHQAYDAALLAGLAEDLPLVMTEKDAVKCRDFAQENWWYLAVDARLASQFDQQLLTRLRQVAAHKKRKH